MRRMLHRHGRQTGILGSGNHAGRTTLTVAGFAQRNIACVTHYAVCITCKRQQKHAPACDMVSNHYILTLCGSMLCIHAHTQNIAIFCNLMLML